MIPELLELGRAMRRLIDTSDRRVLVVMSGDLAHTHSAEGPYGYSAAAEPFDLAVGEWGRSLDVRHLRRDAAALVTDAKVCGWGGLLTMHGLLERDLAAWKSQVHALAHPTFYGMMVMTALRHYVDPELHADPFTMAVT